MDWFYVGLTLAFFALSGALVAGLERLRGPQPAAARESTPGNTGGEQ